MSGAGIYLLAPIADDGVYRVKFQPNTAFYRNVLPVDTPTVLKRLVEPRKVAYIERFGKI